MFAEKQKSFCGTCVMMTMLTGVVTAGALTVAFVMPNRKSVPVVSVMPKEVPVAEDATFETKVSYDNSKLDIDTYGDDVELALYRNSATRPAVEWFYTRVTGSRATALAILAESDRNDIPPSLAFSLAYAESRYNVRAINTNANRSIDRGLFQLNNRTFTNLSEADFFDPEVNARHGLSHLRFCIGAAGNTVSALAMYNAGTTKVRSDNTPRTTLSYIGKIMGYKQNIEELFANEVLRYYSGKDGGEGNGTDSVDDSGAMHFQTAVAYNK